MIYFKHIIIINLLPQVDPENFPKISPYSRPLPIHLTPKLSYYVPLPPPKKKTKKNRQKIKTKNIIKLSPKFENPISATCAILY